MKILNIHLRDRNFAPRPATFARMEPTFDLISTGEYLIDLISTNYTDTFSDATEYKRIPGGSPANMCMNMARAGAKTKLIATVGQDDNGTLLIDLVQRLGVNGEDIRRSELPTTLILVTRSREVSNFEAYRSADTELTAAQFSGSSAKIFHTTCFALSREPARSSILRAAAEARLSGSVLSLDANYAPKIWPDPAEARRTVIQYISHGAHLKMSEVDYERLFEEPLKDLNQAADKLLTYGAGEVVLTLGGEGCFVANRKERHRLTARNVTVKDTTGAGDAFWAGYWTGWLRGESALDRCRTGMRLAELKLGHFGPLPDRVSI